MSKPEQPCGSIWQRVLGMTLAVSLLWCASALGAARPGKPAKVTEAEKAAMARLGEELKASIVWSSSRVSGKHDIFIMNADGSEKRALTKSNNVDWFSRFSPDGKQVLFVRSKMAWTSESHAYRHKRWDLFIINVDGTEEKKLVSDACWGDWKPDGKGIIFARNDKAFVMDLATGEETLLLDSKEPLRGAILQQPGLSPDGKYLTITLRGRRRETGIWDLEKGEWTKTGGGCQIAWFPSGNRIYWVNPTARARGGSEIFNTDVKDGKPVDPKAGLADLRLIDLPGRRSHEYFPKMSKDGKWLVWCATIRGHDHDLYDYEVLCWHIGTPAKQVVRLTFHSGNDRWPDIYIPEAPENIQQDEGAEK